MNSIIIDDEQLARDIVRTYLKEYPNIKVVGECNNGFEGLKMIERLKPDLVFLDIQMPKITGFEMLELVDYQPIVIFSTAYDQYAIKAFEMNATDYLLKPYVRDRFVEAIRKAMNKFSLSFDNQRYTQIIYPQSENTLSRIVVKHGNRINIIPIEDIVFIKAQDDYVEIHTSDKKYLKQMTMKYLESHLPKDVFVRTHRSYIASIPFINKIEAYEKETYLLYLNNGKHISVSRSGYSRLKKILNF